MKREVLVIIIAALVIITGCKGDKIDIGNLGKHIPKVKNPPTTNDSRFTVTACLNSDDCLYRGKCSPDDTGKKCVARTNADCRQSDACTSRGQCSAKSGKCEVGYDISCRESTFCEALGLCTKSGNKCIAIAESCLHSRGCPFSGACMVYKGKCVAMVAEDCQRSYVCKIYGACSLNEKRYECMPQKDQDCQQSRNCRVRGLCKSDGARCVASLDGCQQSFVCHKDRRCTLSSYGQCIKTAKALPPHF